MKLVFCPLYSGSSGNALYVGNGKTGILIDAGLPGRTVVDALNQIHVLPETLRGIIVTHELSDHVTGGGVLSRKYHLPVYANEKTFCAMDKTVGVIEPRNRRYFQNDLSFYIDELEIKPFSIPHDAADPVGFHIFCGGHSIATATDVGHLTKSIVSELSGSDLVLLESNFDPDLLMQNPHYSSALKKRILGNRGHLSNQTCANALCELYKRNVTHVVLGHLSGENNSPELALNTTLEALAAHGITPGQDMEVDLAWRSRVGSVYIIG